MLWAEAEVHQGNPHQLPLAMAVLVVVALDKHPLHLTLALERQVKVVLAVLALTMAAQVELVEVAAARMVRERLVYF